MVRTRRAASRPRGRSSDRRSSSARRPRSDRADRADRPLRRLAVLGTAASLGAVVGWATERTWRSATDPVGPDGLALPEGKERIVRTDDGAELVVVVAGRRRRGRATVVLAHCWTGSRLAWAAVARRLVEGGHQVILYDQRGHGASTSGDEPPTVDRLGRDLATVLEELNVRDAVLAGHSMGGFTVLAFACDHPELLAARVRGLALVATAAHGLNMGPRLHPFGARVFGSTVMARAMARPRLGLFLVRGVTGRRPVHAHLTATRDMFLATDPATRAACFAGFGQMDLREGLADVPVPAVVLVGTHDGLTPPRLGRGIAESLPNARFELIPDAGHMLPLEDPDRVAGAIVELASRSRHV